MTQHFLLAVLLPLLISFGISAGLGPVVIPMLRRLKAQQTERDDGPKSHLAKTGTPNMGGIMIMAGYLITGLIFSIKNPEIIPVLFITLGFSFVGFLDDYIKVVKKRSLGLRAYQKMILQLLISLIFALYITYIHHIPMDMMIPFAGGRVLRLGILSIPALLFISVATVNGTNLTDGVDGLSTSVTIVVALFYAAVAYISGSQTTAAAAAMAGALLGFLVHNCHPAKVFMGDTGSLALGGFVVGMSYMLQLPLFIPIVGFIYLIETLSVMIQVAYFKKTKGKRFFKMAPLHHHFELSGWSETKVVTIFTIVTLLLCFTAFAGVTF